MASPDAYDALFDVRVWRPALTKFGAVTDLTVTLFDAEAHVRCCDPESPSPLFGLFRDRGFAPGILPECAQACLAQDAERPAAVVTESYGLGVVGTPLVLDGVIVAAVVAGYALVDFCQSTTMAALARQAGIPFRTLWSLAQQQQPVPPRRLTLHGELLQVLGETILRELRRTLQYEETAARLETEASVKDEFLAVLSHELRTPLTPILGWVRVLEEAGDDSPRRAKAAQSIKRNALLQVKLVDDLLDLNRVARDKILLDLAVYEVSDLVRSTIDTVAESAAVKHIGIEFRAPTTRVTVEGDAGRLQQVFGNVLSNAIKFTPRDGHVRVTIDAEDDSAVVSIVDTGEGIPEAFLPYVFDMFRQQEEGTRRRHSGLGVGLALVKRLVELHHGRVDVTSAGVGQGTQITVRLPLSKDAERGSAGASERADPAGPALAALTLLVIEDTPDTLEATRTLLEMRGARVLVARDGRDALEVLARTGDVDLILCDLRMPVMDGFEFVQELFRTAGPVAPPVVAMTSFASLADRDRTRAAGFADHLKKPFDAAALTAIVRSTLDARRSSTSRSRAVPK
jgi:signal transduction histidine kinase/ActR/RegA family two-component response regulator